MVRNLMVRRFILFIAILLLGWVSLSAGQSSSIRFVDESGQMIAQVEIVERSGSLYFPVQTLRKTFDPGMSQSYTALNKRLTLNLKEQQLQLRIGSLAVSVNSDETQLSLSHPPLIVEEVLMLPLEFFTGLLPKIYDFMVVYDPIIQTIHLTEKAAPLPDLSSAPATEGPAKFLVILDPGHGGTDIGSRGSTLVTEKDIVLNFAKQIEAIARENQVEVLLTRDADFERRPQDRIDIAQKNHGKLFLSLHCNVSFSERAAGIHLYVSNSLGRTQLGRPPVSIDAISGNSTTIETLSQEEFLAQSRQFAVILQKELEGASPAPISLTEIPLATLATVYMPAVLIEIGYLSNEADETRLTNPENLASMAMGIVQAIQTYVTESDQLEETADDR